MTHFYDTWTRFLFIKEPKAQKQVKEDGIIYFFFFLPRPGMEWF